MGINVVDFKQAREAGLALEDQATKALTEQILPVVAAAANDLLGGSAELLRGILKEFVEDLHGVLDRVNGTQLQAGGGVHLEIPPQVVK